MTPTRPEDAPEGFEIRAVSPDDAPAVAELINEVTIAETGVPWTSVEEVRDDLGSPGRNASPAEPLLVAEDGSLAGYVQFWVRGAPYTSVEMIVFVPPRLWGRGLSAWLIRLGEARVSKHPSRGESLVVRVSRFADNDPAARLFSSLGYSYERTFWVMRTDLREPPAAPILPEGIRIRAFEPGRDEVAVHAALAEAFADHWGDPFPDLERWRHTQIEGQGSGFEPDLWFVGVEGEEVVGAAGCRATSPRSEDTAEVKELGVRRGWRRRGVGLALLQAAFVEFHRRGIGRAELGVDAESPTGATRLYERAGMHVAFSWEVWEKPLV